MGDEPATLQSRLERAGGGNPPAPRAPGPTVDDLVGLVCHLEVTGRFHRDGGFGRILHPRSASFREYVPTNSLHIVVDGNHVAAHVDRVSPLGVRPERPPRYSVKRTVAHNLVGAAQDLVSLLRGRQGDHRSELDCEWVWDPSASEPQEQDLLDPKTSAWSLQLEARVTGALDEPRLRQALATALVQRPVNREILDVVECPDDASLDAARAELQTTPVPVTEWPPLRARLARHHDGDVLMLNLNHGATDSVGALRVMQVIAKAYAGDTDLGPLPDFLAVSDLPVRPASAPVSKLHAQYRRLVERLHDLLARPARFAPDQATDEAGYGFHLVRLSADDTRRIVRPDRPGTSRNALLAALHLAVGDWNLRHGTPGRRVGVLVPVNLRPPGWPEDVVANFSVTARVSTSRRHRSGPETVLRAITSQTIRNKRTRTGVALLAGLQRSGLLPLWAKQSLVVLQPLTRNRRVDTAMLANLGGLEEPPSFGAGAGETIEVWFSVPARTPGSLCIGAVTVAGRLHLTFRYPHRLFGPGSVSRFADTFVEQIGMVAGRM
ncbi:MAG: hypothetical protein ACRD1K_07655 [Acidimicrobiales bacterium]